MLKFERTSQDAVVSIRLKSRSSFFDRALLQALLWSFLFHLLLFGTFRIRLNTFNDNSPTMAPIAVAIEHEPQEAVTSVAALHQEQEAIESQGLFTQSVESAVWQAACIDNIASRASKSPTSSFLFHGSNDEDLLNVQKEVAYAPTLYPLQLSCSRSLRALAIVDDGSNLFRTKGPKDDLGKLYLSKQSYPIEYKVKIEGATGKVVRWERKYELLDKDLQKIADRLINVIRFAPFSKRSAKGSLTLTFCATSEEIQELLK